MLLLTSTSDLVRVTPAQAASIEVHASWVDNASGTITPGRTNTAANSGTSVFTVVGSPGPSTQRNVKFLSVRNDHASASSTIEVDHTDGTNAETLWKGALLAGEAVVMDESGTWILYDAAGVAKANAVPGRFISMTVKTSGTTHTVSNDTNNIRVRCVAGGGGGGNATGNATQTAVAGGGAAGGYVEKWFPVTPNTQYSLTVGTGGGSGVNGVDSTFVVGATTITAKGGQTGSQITQTNTTVIMVPGGQGTLSTNGDINGGGDCGKPGVRSPGTAATAANTFTSGAGGSSPFGGGGVGSGTAGNGANGTGFGAGGAGGLSNSASANNGGAGSDGVVIIEEYT